MTISCLIALIVCGADTQLDYELAFPEADDAPDTVREERAPDTLRSAA